MEDRGESRVVVVHDWLWGQDSASRGDSRWGIRCQVVGVRLQLSAAEIPLARERLRLEQFNVSGGYHLEVGRNFEISKFFYWTSNARLIMKNIIALCSTLLFPLAIFPILLCGSPSTIISDSLRLKQACLWVRLCLCLPLESPLGGSLSHSLRILLLLLDWRRVLRLLLLVSVHCEVITCTLVDLDWIGEVSNIQLKML